VVQALRAAGHEVYDFRNPAPGNTGFGWRQIDPRPPSEWSTEDYRQILASPRAQEGFALDMHALKTCDACVLLLPCPVPTSATYCSYGCITAAAGKNDYCKSGPATPVMINPNNLTIFQHGNYSGYYLLWDDNTMKGTQGGWRFQFNTSYDVQKGTKTRINESDDTTGQCATLAKQLSADAIPRIPWQRGDNVMTSGSVPIGTAIATFSSAGSYDNGHSGYFGGYVYDSATGLPNGFIMYDENWTYEGLVGSHTLKTSGSTYLSNAGSYYVATATP
jgi:hypothetical protein